MQLEIDFNNPRILKGYLEQALPQYGLEEVGVTVGRNGGLAYLLFKNDDWQRLPRELKVNTMNQIDAFRGYFDAVQSYVTAASVHAERFGFALVTVDGFQVLSPGLGRDSSVYQSGNFEGSYKISKRGSSILRWAIYQAAQAAVKFDPVFKAYYLKKKSEGKRHRVIIGHVTKKLLRVIHSILKNNTTYSLNTH